MATSDIPPSLRRKVREEANRVDLGPDLPGIELSKFEARAFCDAADERDRLREGIQHERDRIFAVKSSTSNRLSMDAMLLANGILDRLANLLYDTADQTAGGE